jgi:hypothetical protein
MSKLVIPSDFLMPILPGDAPQWARDMINSLGYSLRQLAVREDRVIDEGLYASMPASVGTKRYYYATDTNKLYYDTDAGWQLINPDPPAETSQGSGTDNQVTRYNGTGAVLQNSLATIDDSGSVNIPTSQQYKVNNAQHTHVKANITDLGGMHYAKMIRGNAQSIPDNTVTTIGLDTVISDAHGLCNTSGHYIQVALAGYYLVTAKIGITVPAGAWNTMFGSAGNYSTTDMPCSSRILISENQELDIVWSSIVYFNANNLAEVNIWHAAGTDAALHYTWDASSLEILGPLSVI